MRLKFGNSKAIHGLALSDYPLASAFSGLRREFAERGTVACCELPHVREPPCLRHFGNRPISGYPKLPPYSFKTSGDQILLRCDLILLPERILKSPFADSG